MGDSQTRLGEGQNGRIWRQGGELLGKIGCGAAAAYFGAGRIGILVASQICGQIFGELGSQVPNLLDRRQPTLRPNRQFGRGRRTQGSRRPGRTVQGNVKRPTTPQELFLLQQQGFDPLGQIPGIPTRQSVPRDRTQGSLTMSPGPSDFGQGSGGLGQSPSDFEGPGQAALRLRSQPSLTPTGRQEGLRQRSQPRLGPTGRQTGLFPDPGPLEPAFPTLQPFIPPNAIDPTISPGDPIGFITPGGEFIPFPGTLDFPHVGSGIGGFIIRGIGTLGPFIGLPPGGA